MLLRDLSSNGKLRLTGRDRVRFLNGLFTNDVARLVPGTGCPAAMLTVKGKLVGDAIILCDEDALWLDLDPRVTDRIAGALDRHLIVDDVVIEDRSAALDEVAAIGEDAIAAVERALGPIPPGPSYAHVAIGETRVVRLEELGRPAFRLVGGARAIAARLGDAIWLDEAAAEVLRIEAGIPRYGSDMGEDHLLLESGLDHVISQTKGCYMGQEVIARFAARGHLNRKLLGLRLEGNAPAVAGAKLSSPGRDDAGVVTSSVVSPRFGAIALAYVHKSAWPAGSELTVSDAAGPRKAVVSELPFGAAPRAA